LDMKRLLLEKLTLQKQLLFTSPLSKEATRTGVRKGKRDIKTYQRGKKKGGRYPDGGNKKISLGERKKKRRRKKKCGTDGRKKNEVI